MISLIDISSIKQQFKHFLLALSLGIKRLGLALAIYCLAIAPLGQGAIAAPNSAVSVAMERSADQLDEMVGAGTSDQIQGKAQRDIGTVKRELGKATGQLEGATEQAKGRAREDIGKFKSAVDEAVDDSEDVAEGLMNSIKDIFN